MKTARFFFALSISLALVTAAHADDPLIWEYRYNGPGPLGNCDIGKGICQATDGTIYATGQASGYGPGYSDLVITCLDPDGTEKWVHLYDGGINEFDIGYSIAADAAGNVYAAGDTKTPGTGADFLIVSVDPSGSERWAYRYDGGARESDSAFTVTVGADGNIYAGGICTVNASQGADMIVVSLAPDGTERWVHHFNGGSDASDAVWDITFGQDGNVYAAGILCRDLWGDFCVFSFTSNGQPRWLHTYSGTAGSEDTAYQVIWGGDNNLYAVGKSSEIGRSRDFCVVSLTPDGTERWIYLYNGAMNIHDVGHCITWAADGNLYAGGKTVEPGGDAFTILSLTPSGTERWTWTPTWDGYNGVFSIATDAESNTYACGWIGSDSGGPGHGYSFTMGAASTDALGQERWSISYGEPDTFSGVADELVWDDTRRTAYCVGMINSYSSSDFVVLGLDPGLQPDISLTVTPHNPPIVIPPTGGSFSFDVAVTNNESTAQTFDLWAFYTLPNGTIWPLPLGPVAVTLAPGGMFQRANVQDIPAFVPAGSYRLTVYLGIFPLDQWSSDGFPFTKQ